MISVTKPDNFSPRFEVSSCFLEYKDRFLLLHRQDHKPQGNTWGVPAGKVEKGETSAQAIIREMQEEISLTVTEQNLIYFKSLYVRYSEYDFVYHIFSSVCQVEPKIVIDVKDHKDFQWVTPKESLTMNLIQDEDFCVELFYNNRLRNN
ncbi:MAG: NUDIX hydrolase [Candidatus Taylorbacteria bacterium]|nr:NUDIX hydrolase [Candidatus Taylorbacteria bacterium]